MSAQGHARLAWSLLTAFVLMVAGALALTALSGESAIEGNDYAAFGWVAVFAPFPIVGALIASRRAGGALGWICIAVGLAVGLTALAQRYAMYAVVAEPGALPAGEYFAYVENWSWVVPIGLIGVFLVLLFPDGKLPSPRWRWLVYVASGGMATAIVALSLAPAEGVGAIPVENPIGIERAEGAADHRPARRDRHALRVDRRRRGRDGASLPAGGARAAAAAEVVRDRRGPDGGDVLLVVAGGVRLSQARGRSPVGGRRHVGVAPRRRRSRDPQVPAL